MKLRKLYVMALAIMLAVSCGTPKNITYFQDAMPGDVMKVEKPVEIRLRPKDKISIIVSCQDARLTTQFNLPIISQSLGDNYATGAGGVSRGISGYTVNANGDIDFPVIGMIHVSGMTRDEVASYVKLRLQNEDLLKDPVVTVEFMNLGISVLGEVNHPGRIEVKKDHVTILDALSMAGDLTIYGRREMITVLRQEKGMQKTYCVDLTRATDVYASPVYYLQQDDVVYVEPNAMRIRQSTVNGNTTRTPSFWMSVVSFLVTVGNVISTALLLGK